MFEVELKFSIADAQQLECCLHDTGAIEQRVEQHSDTYYNHPSRDFAETQEAFRVRRVDGVPMVTYKGTKLPGAVKARRELEWRLDPGDEDGSKMEELLSLLSFRRVAEVRKSRRCFKIPTESAPFSVVIDDVESLGCFAEVELVVAGPDEVEAARDEIQRLAQRLGLHQVEPRSYLRMILEAGAS